MLKNYQLKAVRTAYLILGERPAAENLVQASFLRVYECIHQFDEARSFGPWFLRIVVNDVVKSAP